MPPKIGKVTKRNGKRKPPTVARPEAPFVDEGEAAMLWGKVHRDDSSTQSRQLPMVVPVGFNAGPQTVAFPRGSLNPLLTLHPCQSLDVTIATSQDAITQESATEAVLARLQEAIVEDEAVSDAIDAEVTILRDEAAHLTDACQVVEKGIREEREQHVSIVTTEQQAADAHFYMLEDTLERLQREAPAVDELLLEKVGTLQAIEDRNTELARLSADHTTAMSQLATQLTEQRKRLDEAMVAKLRCTTEEMQRLSAEQVLSRQRRAAVELSRLTAEFAALDGQADECETRTATLRESLDTVRRELELENGRRALLERKAGATAATLQGLVETVTALDAGASRGASTVPDGGDRAQARVIDEQYADMIRLRSDFADVEREVDAARLALLDVRRPQFAFKPLLMDTVLCAASDVGQLLMQSSGGQLDDAIVSERAAFLGYIVRRCNNVTLSM